MPITRRSVPPDEDRRASPNQQGLTVRQAAFVREFLIDLNGKQAAIRAGYSPNGAGVQACRLFADANVAKAIAKAQTERAARTEITADRVLRELAKIGFANMGDYMRSSPSGDPYLDFSALTDDQTAALQEVTVDDYVEGRGDDARTVKRVKFKLYDKRAALVEIGRHLGMFVERHEVTGKDGGPIQVLTDDQLATYLSRSGIVIDAAFEDVTDGVGESGRGGSGDAPPLGREEPGLLGPLRSDLLRPR